MNAEELKTILENHKTWMETNWKKGEKADLRGADLRGANLDYSCLPLWCGSLDMKVDKRIAAQIAYHFCRLVCDDEEVKHAQNAIAGLANQFHRVEECGKIEAKGL